MKKTFWTQKNISVYAILAGLCILYFNQIILGKYYFFEDFLYQYYPFRNFYATSIRKGIFPLWDPYIFSGMSLIGDIQSALFYPFNIILILFVKNGLLSFYILELQNILHILLAGVFTYMYSREIKLSEKASLVSAVTFMFSGFLITRTIHLTFVNVIVWLPLILLFLQKALKENSYFYSILGGLASGISMLAGSPQLSLHIFYFLGAYTIFFIIINKKNYSTIKSFLLLGIILITSLGISAIQYMPAFEYSKYTVRMGISLKDSSILSIHPVQLLTFLVPKLFGSVSAVSRNSVPFWAGGGEYGAFWETAVYIGIFPLVLLFFAFKDKRNKMIWFFAFMAAFSLFSALGKYAPLYRFIYYCLPGFNKFRIPGRFSGILSFSLSILAGFGANNFFDKKDIRFPKVIFWIVGVVFIFWILIFAGVFKNINQFTGNINVYNNIQKQYCIFVLFISLSIAIVFLRTKKLLTTNILSALIIVLIFIDLYTFGSNFNKSEISPEQYYPFNNMVRQLQIESKTDKFRINARKENYMILQRNSGNIYNLELVEGYTPLRIKRYSEFSQLPVERKLDLLNVKYRLEIDKENRMMGLALNTDYLPRAFMVYKYILVKEENRILKILSTDEFDYLNEIILEESPEIELPAQGEKPEYKIEADSFGINRISFKIHTSVPGILVLSEIYYPAWQAKIDGKETKIYCADYLLRAIPIERGTHQVELTYNSVLFSIGRIVTACTLILAVCLLFIL